MTTVGIWTLAALVWVPIGLIARRAMFHAAGGRKWSVDTEAAINEAVLMANESLYDTIARRMASDLDHEWLALDRRVRGER